MTDLGILAGTTISAATFINSRTQVVGHSFACDFSVFNAFLWEKGSIVDLNTLIPSSSPFHLYTASFIGDGGVIAAFGLLPNGDSHALLLIPCDQNHPGLEDCDDSLADVATAASRPAPVVPNVSSRPLPPFGMRQGHRPHFPRRAFGPRN